MFHEVVTESMAGRTMRNFNDFESVLVSAGRAGGTCVRKRYKFKESRELHTHFVWIVDALGQLKTENG